jgi:hypothetical protein
MLYEQLAEQSDLLSPQWQLRLLTEARHNSDLVVPELLCSRDDLCPEADLILRGYNNLSVRMAYVRAHEGDTDVLAAIARQESRQKVLAEVLRCAPDLPRSTVKVVIKKLSSSVLAAALLVHAKLQPAERAMVAQRLTSISQPASLLQGELQTTLIMGIDANPKLLDELFVSTTNLDTVLALATFEHVAFSAVAARHITSVLTSWFTSLGDTDDARVGKFMSLRRTVYPYRFADGVLRIMLRLSRQPEFRTGVVMKRVKHLTVTVERSLYEPHFAKLPLTTPALVVCEQILVAYDARSRELLRTVAGTDPEAVAEALHNAHDSNYEYPSYVWEEALRTAYANPVLDRDSFVDVLQVLSWYPDDDVVQESPQTAERFAPFDEWSSLTLVNLLGMAQRDTVPWVLVHTSDQAQLMERLLPHAGSHAGVQPLNWYQKLESSRRNGHRVDDAVFDLLFEHLPVNAFFGHTASPQDRNISEALSQRAAAYVMGCLGTNEDAWLTFTNLASTMHAETLVTVTQIAVKVVSHE